MDSFHLAPHYGYHDTSICRPLLEIIFSIWFTQESRLEVKHKFYPTLKKKKHKFYSCYIKNKIEEDTLNIKQVKVKEFIARSDDCGSCG